MHGAWFRSSTLFQFLREMLWLGTKSVLVMVLLLLRRWNCNSLSMCWLNRWNGDGCVYAPNRRFLQLQLERPSFILLDFISQKGLQSLQEGSWLYCQYMAYLARVLEKGSFRMLLDLDMVEVFVCISDGVLAWMTGSFLALKNVGSV